MNSTNKLSAKISVISLFVLVLVTFFTSLYMNGLNSGIPLYYDEIGYSATISGTLVAVFTISSTVMRLLGGPITDYFSHYKVLLVSLAAMLIGVILPNFWDAFAIIIISRIFQGASFALATNVMTVAVMGSASKEHIGRRVGIKGAGTSLGTMFGAVIATWLLDDVGYQWFYIFYAILIVVSIIAILILHAIEKASKNNLQSAKSISATSSTDLKEEPENQSNLSTIDKTASENSSKKRSLKSHIHEVLAPYFISSVMPYMAISFAYRMPKGLCVSFILIFAKHLGIEMGAIFFVVAGLTTLICRISGGKLFDSNHTWVLLPLMIMQIAGFAILAIAPSFATLIIAGIGYGLSEGATSPYLKAITAKAIPKKHWGTANGELFFFSDIGKALGAFCGGLIIDATAKSFIPVVGIIFSTITALITIVAIIIEHHMKKSNSKKS